MNGIVPRLMEMPIDNTVPTSNGKTRKDASPCRGEAADRLDAEHALVLAHGDSACAVGTAATSRGEADCRDSRSATMSSCRWDDRRSHQEAVAPPKGTREYNR